MDILLYVLLGGSLAINAAVSVQVYRLHKSVLDLKEQLNVKDSSYDSAIREQMDTELGVTAERKAAEKAERKARQEAEDNAWREKSTIFDEDEPPLNDTDSNNGAIYFSSDAELDKKIEEVEPLIMSGTESDSITASGEAIQEDADVSEDIKSEEKSADMNELETANEVSPDTTEDKVTEVEEKAIETEETTAEVVAETVENEEETEEPAQTDVPPVSEESELVAEDVEVKAETEEVAKPATKTTSRKTSAKTSSGSRTRKKKKQ